MVNYFGHCHATTTDCTRSRTGKRRKCTPWVGTRLSIMAPQNCLARSLQFKVCRFILVPVCMHGICGRICVYSYIHLFNARMHVHICTSVSMRTHIYTRVHSKIHSNPRFHCHTSTCISVFYMHKISSHKRTHS